METFKFELDDSLKEFVANAERVANKMIEDSVLGGHAVADKLLVCSMATRRMLEGQEITQPELQGILDSVGGYFMAVRIYCEKHGGTEKQLRFAEDLLNSAIRLQDIAKSFWKLTLIQGGKA